MTHVENSARKLRDFLDHHHVTDGVHCQPWHYGNDVRRHLRALCWSLLREIDTAARLHSPDRAESHQLHACRRCQESEQEFGGLCRWCDAFEYGDDHQLALRPHKGGRVEAMAPNFMLLDRKLIEGEALEVLVDGADGSEPWVWKQGTFRIANDLAMVVSADGSFGCNKRRVRRVADKITAQAAP